MMGDYPARSRGFLLAYGLVFIALGGAALAGVLAYGPRIDKPAAEATPPAVTDQHWSGAE